ncbi:MAG: hypothetical protein LBR53_12685 [Deltaproteobacteria bacterium]|nr:hypothetical protein [Deltaproteobacteria bacterium]
MPLKDAEDKDKESEPRSETTGEETPSGHLREAEDKDKESEPRNETTGGEIPSGLLKVAEDGKKATDTQNELACEDEPLSPPEMASARQKNKNKRLKKTKSKYNLTNQNQQKIKSKKKKVRKIHRNNEEKVDIVSTNFKKNQFERRTPDSGKEETTLIDKTSNEKGAGVPLKDLTRGSFQPSEKDGKVAKPASKPSIHPLRDTTHRRPRKVSGSRKSDSEACPNDGSHSFLGRAYAAPDRHDPVPMTGSLSQRKAENKRKSSDTKQSSEYITSSWRKAEPTKISRFRR